jgi:SAM-dependent methyltransferase
VRRALEYVLERGFLDRVLEHLSAEDARRVRHRLRRLARPARLRSLRRRAPLSDDFGYDRGTPIDRYYIEQFLQDHRGDVRGRVLEVKDTGYTERIGTAVTQKDVVDIDPANPLATIVADLSCPREIPDASFDCFILTQTLQYIRDLRSAIEHARRILKPGGVLLATVPAVSPIVEEAGLTDYWRFTPASCLALFGDVFGVHACDIRSYGNFLTAIGFLMGIAYEELTTQELDTDDRRFSILIAVRAVKR